MTKEELQERVLDLSEEVISLEDELADLNDAYSELEEENFKLSMKLEGDNTILDVSNFIFQLRSDGLCSEELESFIWRYVKFQERD